MTGPHIFYSDHYDISLWGIEKLHPFDANKPRRALQRIRTALGSRLDGMLQAPGGPVSAEALRSVHAQGYLDSLGRSSVVAQALEVWPLRLLPSSIIERHALEPMRWAVQGTIDATRAALQHGAACNLSGGYHHAHRDRGEGFCIYADIPIAIETLRKEGVLAADAHVGIVDLDAHRGNGFESIYARDPYIDFFDIYNFQVYPGRLRDESARFADIRSLRAFMRDEGYFNILTGYLPKFLAKQPFSLLFYNAGTDVLEGDPIGRFALTREAVLQRDRFVLEAIEALGVPWVMVPSGGYTEESHKLLADTVIWAHERN
jgi:histone deacetylase 11